MLFIVGWSRRKHKPPNDHRLATGLRCVDSETRATDTSPDLQFYDIYSFYWGVCHHNRVGWRTKSFEFTMPIEIHCDSPTILFLVSGSSLPASYHNPTLVTFLRLCPQFVSGILAAISTYQNQNEIIINLQIWGVWKRRRSRSAAVDCPTVFSWRICAMSNLWTVVRIDLNEWSPSYNRYAVEFQGWNLCQS